ncbi:MAG: hypothetical protein J6W35_04340 [Eubacterium sp.]|nr:hypothetical protein [Eubacterium sp.]
MFSRKAKAPKPTREDKKDRKIPLTKYARGGRISSTIGLCNLALMSLTITMAVMENGKSGMYIGIIVILIFISALMGFVIGIRSFSEENKFYRFSYIGTVINAIIWISIILIYIAYI